MHEYFDGIELHAFGPADVIFTELKFSVIGGIVIGLPLLLQQLWLFVVPGDSPAYAAHGLCLHHSVAAAGGAGAGLRPLRRDPARHLGAAAHHRCGRDADLRSRGDAQLRDDPARALRDNLSNADRSDRIGAARHRERAFADPVPASRDLRVLHRRRHRQHPTATR